MYETTSLLEVADGSTSARNVTDHSWTDEPVPGSRETFKGAVSEKEEGRVTGIERRR